MKSIEAPAADCVNNNTLQPRYLSDEVAPMANPFLKPLYDGISRYGQSISIGRQSCCLCEPNISNISDLVSIEIDEIKSLAKSMNHRIFPMLIGILFLILIIFKVVMDSVKVAKTHDVIGRIAVTMDRTLTQKAWEAGYDPVLETAHEFPDVRIKNHQILDEWNSFMVVEIENGETAFYFKIISPGKDRKIGTNDDLKWSGRIDKEQ